MNHGIKLADGTFFAGTAGKVGDRVELTISEADAMVHLADLMDPEKTKWIGFYANQLVAEYTNCVFSFLQKDSSGKFVNVWFEEKGQPSGT